VDDKYESKIIDSVSLFIPRVFESLFVRIELNNKKSILLGNIYRPPQTNILSFNENLNLVLNQISTDPSLKVCQLIISGDFNIDLLKVSTHADTTRYFDLLLENSLFPVISKPTRISHSSATLIDHILVKDLNSNSKSGIFLDSLSDHCPIYFLLGNSAFNNSKAEKVRTRIINEKSKEKFISLLANQNWSVILNENRPEKSFALFFEKVSLCYEESFPFTDKIKTIKNSPLNPWMSSALLNSRKRKQHLYARKLSRPTLHNIQQFKNYSNSYKSLCRAAKRRYYSSKIEKFRNDSKKTWEVVREVLGSVKDKSNIPSYFSDNGSIIQGSYNIAQGFNNFFCEIGPKLAESIPSSSKSYKDYLGNEIEENFVFKNITIDAILDIGGKLKPKNSVGLDCFSSKQLKDVLPLLAEPISHVFNLSIQTGYIPNEFKTARVIPIYKSDSEFSFNNYRPISLLPALSKLLEKIVAKQMCGFIEKNKILYDLQFGFRKNHNTTQPLILFLDKIYTALNKDNPEYTIAVFLDLKKAFDTTSHTILIDKLKHYGFRGTANIWFSNYLNNRKQVVSINGTDSEKCAITIGVPQGSVLGPILFLLFINCLPNAVSFLTLLFADDTTFQLSGNNIRELFDKVNNELEQASDWFNCNKLILNVSKTKFIVFGPNNKKINLNNLSLSIGGEILERIGNDCPTKSFKFVGVNIDENLSWNTHINKVKSKISFASLQISRLKNIFPTETLVNLYNGLFRPHMEFGLLAWGGAQPSKLKGLINCQKKCIRNINKSKYNSHTGPIFKKLNILKFHDLFDLNCKLFMHSFVHNKLPSCFGSMFSKSNSLRTNNIVLQICKKSSLRNLPSFILPSKWNSLTQDLKALTNRISLKNHLSADYLNSYKNISCNNIMCPDCHNG